jgi:spore germination protein GerM
VRRRIIPLLAVALTGACSIADSGSFERIPNASVPFDLSSPAETRPVVTTTVAVDVDEADGELLLEPVNLYYVAGSRLVRVQRQLATPATSAQVLAALTETPTADPGLAGLRSALPRGLPLEVEVSRGVARVDASRPLLDGLSALDQRLAIAQIVLTLTSRPGVGQVVITVEGSPIAVPRGRGDLVAAGTPVTYDDYASLVIGATGQ